MEENAEAVDNFYGNNDTAHGISAVGTCAPTAETGRFDTIATDTRTSIGSLFNYSKTFNNWRDRSVIYRGSLGSAEDGCDQAAFHITICDEEEPTPPAPEVPGSSDVCMAAVGGIAGAALVALPLALASQIEIPGVSAMVRDAQDQIARANTEIQRHLGIYNKDLGFSIRPEHAQWLGAGVASVVLFAIVAAALAPCVSGGASSTDTAKLSAA